MTRDRTLWLPLREPLNYRILSADEAMLARRQVGVRELCPELDGETAVLDLLRTSDGKIAGFRILPHVAAVSVLEFVEPSPAVSVGPGKILFVLWRDGDWEEDAYCIGLLLGAWFLIDREQGLILLVREEPFHDLRLEQLFE